MGMFLVIPARNEEKYIVETIKSILLQKYKNSYSLLTIAVPIQQ